jgi:hypothetical protein
MKAKVVIITNAYTLSGCGRPKNGIVSIEIIKKVDPILDVMASQMILQGYLNAQKAQ